MAVTPTAGGSTSGAIWQPATGLMDAGGPCWGVKPDDAEKSVAMRTSSCPGLQGEGRGAGEAPRAVAWIPLTATACPCWVMLVAKGVFTGCAKAALMASPAAPHAIAAAAAGEKFALSSVAAPAAAVPNHCICISLAMFHETSADVSCPADSAVALPEKLCMLCAGIAKPGCDVLLAKPVKMGDPAAVTPAPGAAPGWTASAAA